MSLSNPSPLSNAERIARIRLSRTENVGPITFKELLQRFGSAVEAIKALPTLAKRGGRRRPLSVPAPSVIEREIADNEDYGAELLVYGDGTYPRQLEAIEDAPPILSILGNAHLLSERSVAIVGARNASLNGRRLAQKMAEELGEAGYVVTSGLARGIDGFAHTGALQTGTIAVIAGGIDVIYPNEHADLYRQIAEAGVIVAESPIGTTPQARHFPSRNRIISGLSLGVMVVEAAKRSGSLITARRALDQGREVFAIPGSPLDSRAAGCNNLIQEGAAHLVQSTDDITYILNGLQDSGLREDEFMNFLPESNGLPEIDLSPEARDQVLDLLASEPVAVDEVIRECQLSPTAVAIILLEAELAGLVDRHPGNQISLRMEARLLA